MSTEKNRTVSIFNKISNNFRELHVDGAYGGVTPKGLININFYAERLSIPKGSEFEIENETNKLKKLSDHDGSKEGIIREFETGVYMTPETAKELYDWLGEHLKSIKKHKPDKE